MAKEIKCPKCGSFRLEKKIRKIAVGSGRGPQHAEYPQEEDYTFYKCLDCGYESLENDFEE